MEGITMNAWFTRSKPLDLPVTYPGTLPLQP